MKTNVSSLTSKFIIYLVPVMVLTLGASSYYNFLTTRQALEHSMESKAESKLTSLVAIGSYYLKNFETELLSDMVTNVQAEDEVLSIAVKNSDGVVEYGKTAKGKGVHVYEKTIASEDGDLGSIEIGLDTSELTATLRNILLVNLTALASVILILSVVVVLFFRKWIIAPVNQVNQAMKKMENGDLNERLAVNSLDEVAELNQHFNTMAESLGRLVSDIKGSSQRMRNSTHKVAITSKDISEMAEGEEQRSAEVTVASAELFSITENVSDLAGKAAGLAEEADQQARTGLVAAHRNISEMESVVGDVSRASVEMAELSETAQSIHAIVGTIQSIAEQTNLLALNAAIEAARAGEQGRGFAVVADEVRTLAARTTDSIGEISGIVNQLTGKVGSVDQSLKTVVERVHSGQQQASTSAQSIEAITDGISTAAQANTEIVEATSDQARRLGVLRARLDGLIDIMKRSAAKANAASVAGNELHQTGEELDGLLGRFSLDLNR